MHAVFGNISLIPEECREVTEAHLLLRLLAATRNENLYFIRNFHVASLCGAT